MKKLCALLLVLAVLAGSLLLFPVGATQGETVQIGGLTYNIIKTVEQFEAMSGNNNYILGNDIDFGGKVYSRVIVEEHFYGIFDGNNYSLLNFSIASTDEMVGIFTTNTYSSDTEEQEAFKGKTYTIRNLTVGSETAPVSVSSIAGNRADEAENGGFHIGVLSGSLADNSSFDVTNVKIYANVSTIGQRAGGFFGTIGSGRANGVSGSFKNCAFYGSVYADASNVGGFIGRTAMRIIFTECENYGNISSGVNRVGGFVGSNYEASYCNIDLVSCTNYGKISGLAFIGGMVGSTDYSMSLTRCENRGVVEATGTRIGGLVGQSHRGADYRRGVMLTLTECKNLASVSSSYATSRVGGLVGDVTANLYVSNCTNEGTVSGGSYVGGIIGFLDPIDTIAPENPEEGKEYTGERFTATLEKVYNIANLTMQTTATSGGAIGGIIGGTSWNAYELTVVINGASNSGNLTNLSASTVPNTRIGGIIGRFDKDNGSLTVKNAVNYGTLAGNGNDTVSGILGYTTATLDTEGTTNVPIARVIENCLNLGNMTNGSGEQKNIYAIAKNYYADKGTMINCYVSEECSAQLSGFGEAEAQTFTAEQLASGEAAMILGPGFGQELGTELLPVIGGNPVLEKNGVLYNLTHEHIFGDNPYEYLNSGKHQRKCSICEENISEAHVYDAFKDNGDGTHSRACKHCSYVSVPQDHKMSYEDNGDGMHTAACSGCDLNKTEEHTADGYTDNGDGTHSGTCTHCGTEFTVEHTYGEGTCTACGASEAENGGTSDDGKTSGTAKTVIIISACVLGGGAVGCGTFLIIKKRKNKLG